ncbi:hypothetical protein ACFZCG_24220 [Streptomyces tanashiensis]|uniref:hypothetical protein n=1 Tax=Streptomyces tanashiensis TaxID=67367 RepID=UPI0036EA9840
MSMALLIAVLDLPDRAARCRGLVRRHVSGRRPRSRGQKQSLLYASEGDALSVESAGTAPESSQAGIHMAVGVRGKGVTER